MMKPIKRIAILLATYNSSKYLKQLLDSLYNQTYQNFTIYVHDDGSTDDTLKILESYRYLNNNIVRVEDDQIGRKAMGSFMYLLEKIDSDYYMFCDHDDIWMPNKIERTLDVMLSTEQVNNNKPIIVCSDMMVVDHNLNLIHRSFWRFSKTNPYVLNNINYLSICNFLAGCTMLINNNTKEQSIPIGDKACMHDIWIALKTISNNGIIVPIDEPLLKYRQHESNVIGAVKVGTLKFLMTRVININDVIKNNIATYEMVAEVNGMSRIKYIWYKLKYSINRYNIISKE